MKLGIIGLGNAYKKQIDAINYYDEIEITGICDTDRNKLNLVNLNVFKTTNYKELVNVCDCVLICHRQIHILKLQVILLGIKSILLSKSQ